MLLHYLWKSKHMKSALKWTKTPKTILDITDSNLEKNNEILIVFGINISNITGKSALANTETQAVQSVL